MSSRSTYLLYFLLIFIHENLVSNDLLYQLSKQQEDILSAQDAFVVSIDIDKSGVDLNWEIAPKHYLYLRDIKTKRNGLDVKYHVRNSNQSKYDDAFFGNVLILKEKFEISILIPDIVNNTQDNITVNYRGCAEAGFCYPMETLSFRISDKIL